MVKTGSMTTDFLTVFCSVKDASSQLIGAQWQFHDPLSKNTNIMDVISPVNISAIIVTWQSESMPHAVPCVFSCHIQTKMTPIMPIKSGAAERCCGCRDTNAFETHKEPVAVAGQWRWCFQNPAFQTHCVYGWSGGGLKKHLFSSLRWSTLIVLICLRMHPCQEIQIDTPTRGVGRGGTG